MKPLYYVLIAISLILLIAVAVVYLRPGSNQRRVTLLEYGQPLASIPVIEAVTGIPRRTDEYGTITYPPDDTTERFLSMINANRWVKVPVPEKGHAIVNLFYQYSVRKTIVYEPGSWFPKEEITEQFYLSDNDLAQIKAKKYTREDVEDYYRKQAQSHMEPTDWGMISK